MAVVDDQRLFTRGLSGLVDMLPGVAVVGVAYDGEEAVALRRERARRGPDGHLHAQDGRHQRHARIKDLLPQTRWSSLRATRKTSVFEGIAGRRAGLPAEGLEPRTSRERSTLSTPGTP